MSRYLVILAQPDPVARAVHDALGTLPSTGEFVEGAAVRRLGDHAAVLARPGLHIHDEALDAQLPSRLREEYPTLVFASIHRSDSGTRCFTVHPLGNLGGAAEVGGRPRTLVTTAPRLMTDALRRLSDGGESVGLRATFEATHHGPFVREAAFFAEIGFGSDPAPPRDAVGVLARVLGELEEDSSDRVVVGVGGGHYAPHFTDLALKRRWAFGHLVSRHALLATDGETARLALEKTPGADGALFARAADLGLPASAQLGPRLSENSAPRREPGRTD